MNRFVSDFRKKYSDIKPNETERIKEAALFIIDSLGLNKQGTEKYPLPVVQMLDQLGFPLYRATFKNPDQSGLIVVDSSLPEKNSVFTSNRAVLVNSADSTAHQRFTIAHEISHYLFDFDETKRPTYYKPYLTTEHEDAIELRANRFAAELLMPTDDFVKECEKYYKDHADLFSLADAITHLTKLFDVPVTAVKLRLREVNCAWEGV